MSGPTEPLLSAADLPTGGSLADARVAVDAARPGEATSDRARLQILEFIATHDDALHRSCLEGHLTGSALVVDAARERVLLMLHAKLGMWLQPGGHADGEGHLASVALTEAHEETGIDELRIAPTVVDCDVHEIPERPGEPRHLHLDLRFVVVAPRGAVARPNHESQGLRWCTPREVDEIGTDSSLRRLAQVGLEVARSLPRP